MSFLFSCILVFLSWNFLFFASCEWHEYSEHNTEKGGKEDAVAWCEHERDSVGRNPEERDSFFEEEAPDCSPVEIYKYLLEVEFREIATESASIVHDMSVAHFVEHHEYRGKDAVHECRNQECCKHVIQRLRREDALADEFAVSSVSWSNADRI